MISFPSTPLKVELLAGDLRTDQEGVVSLFFLSFACSGILRSLFELFLLLFKAD